MTGVKDATLQALRLKYNAAVAAHQGCLLALTEAAMAGTAPSAALLASETRALQELEQARERLLAAMTAAITGRSAEAPLAERASSSVENRPPDAT